MKHRKLPWIVPGVVLVVLMISGASSCGAGSSGQAPAQQPAPSSTSPAASGVVYEVTGDGKAMVSYELPP